MGVRLAITSALTSLVRPELGIRRHAKQDNFRRVRYPAYDKFSGRKKWGSYVVPVTTPPISMYQRVSRKARSAAQAALSALSSARGKLVTALSIMGISRSAQASTHSGLSIPRSHSWQASRSIYIYLIMFAVAFVAAWMVLMAGVTPPSGDISTGTGNQPANEAGEEQTEENSSDKNKQSETDEPAPKAQGKSSSKPGLSNGGWSQKSRSWSTPNNSQSWGGSSQWGGGSESGKKQNQPSKKSSSSSSGSAKPEQNNQGPDGSDGLIPLPDTSLQLGL